MKCSVYWFFEYGLQYIYIHMYKWIIFTYLCILLCVIYTSIRQILDEVNFHFKFSISNVLILWANQIIQRIFYAAILEIIKSTKTHTIYFSSRPKISFIHPAPTLNNSMEISKNHHFIPLLCKHDITVFYAGIWPHYSQPPPPHTTGIHIDISTFRGFSHL